MSIRVPYRPCVMRIATRDGVLRLSPIAMEEIDEANAGNSLLVERSAGERPCDAIFDQESLS